jgi:hypothetical protein
MLAVLVSADKSVVKMKTSSRVAATISPHTLRYTAVLFIFHFTSYIK